MDYKKIKRAQITIFVVVGIIIVAAIIILAVFLTNIQNEKKEFLNPKQYIESCIKEEIPIPIDKIYEGGGLVDPKLFVLYKNVKYNYLCYAPNFWEACSNLYPQLIKVIEQEIKKETEGKIKDCFSRLKDWYENRGYSVIDGNLAFSITILPDKISVLLNKKLEIKKDEEVQIFDNFGASIPSDLFEVISVVQEVVGQEAKFCKFEYLGYTIANPQFRMRFINYDENHIYRIKKADSDKEFRFATRGCVYWRGKVGENLDSAVRYNNAAGGVV
jgi:cell division protein FtsI/penicillin-binding protein 2